MLKFRFPYIDGYIEALTQVEAENLAIQYSVDIALVEPFEEVLAPQYVPSRQGLRIYELNLVHPDLISLPPSKIDFVRHLADDISLKKDVEMAKNGRPIKALYSYQGLKIAEIEFTFQTDSMNFLTRRTEKLGYYNTDDIIPQQYVIRDWVRDLSSQYDTTYVTKERKDARISIFDEIKSKLNVWIYTYYAPLGKTYPEILNIGANFWSLFSSEIDSWINTGGRGTLQDKLMSVDTEENYPFSIMVISPGVTVRDYIIERINY